MTAAAHIEETTSAQRTAADRAAEARIGRAHSGHRAQIPRRLRRQPHHLGMRRAGRGVELDDQVALLELRQQEFYRLVGARFATTLFGVVIGFPRLLLHRLVGPLIGANSIFSLRAFTLATVA